MGVKFVFHGTILGYPRLKAFSISSAGSPAIEKGVKGNQGPIHESESGQPSNREFLEISHYEVSPIYQKNNKILSKFSDKGEFWKNWKRKRILREM
jgi:hypothetical protein